LNGFPYHQMIWMGWSPMFSHIHIIYHKVVPSIYKVVYNTHYISSLRYLHSAWLTHYHILGYISQVTLQ
jgi:hypothetical protein